MVSKLHSSKKSVTPEGINKTEITIEPLRRVGVSHLLFYALVIFMLEWFMPFYWPDYLIELGILKKYIYLSVPITFPLFLTFTDKAEVASLIGITISGLVFGTAVRVLDVLITWFWSLL